MIFHLDICHCMTVILKIPTDSQFYLRVLSSYCTGMAVISCWVPGNFCFISSAVLPLRCTARRSVSNLPLCISFSNVVLFFCSPFQFCLAVQSMNFIVYLFLNHQLKSQEWHVMLELIQSYKLEKAVVFLSLIIFLCIVSLLGLWAHSQIILKKTLSIIK